MSISPNITTDIWVTEPPEGGRRLSRRSMLLGTAASLAGLGSLSFLTPARAQPAGERLTPEMFGARGDGVANDTEAFNRLAQEVTRRGGATIVLRRTTYLVGGHSPFSRPTASYAFPPAPILQFRNLPGALTIVGNGATLRCPPGMRYGTFDPVTGKPTHHT